MFCKNCGQELGGSKKFCANCGAASLNTEQGKVDPEERQKTIIKPKRNTFELMKKISSILIGVVIIGLGIYASLDEDVVKQNNSAVSNFDSGNNKGAIDKLEEASKNAVSDENKINSLKNLAYVYSSEGKNGLAVDSFKEALELTSNDSYDRYLISGEIAVLEGKPDAALFAYNKAYGLKPNDFQINNALSLFYLDIEDQAPGYVDYQKAVQYAVRANQLTNLQVAKQNLGIAYYFNKQFDLAISTLNQVTLDKDKEVSYFIGLSYMRKENLPMAKLYINKAMANGVDVQQEIRNYISSN